MKSDIKIPKEWVLLPRQRSIISPLDYSIKHDVADMIKDHRFYSTFPGGSFLAFIWWAKELSQWAAEVWVSNEYQSSFLSNELQELKEEIYKEYGCESDPFDESNPLINFKTFKKKLANIIKGTETTH